VIKKSEFLYSRSKTCLINAHHDRDLIFLASLSQLKTLLEKTGSRRRLVFGLFFCQRPVSNRHRKKSFPPDVATRYASSILPTIISSMTLHNATLFRLTALGGGRRCPRLFFLLTVSVTLSLFGPQRRGIRTFFNFLTKPAFSYKIYSYLHSLELLT
jgi:hypothetical protein